MVVFLLLISPGSVGSVFGSVGFGVLIVLLIVSVMMCCPVIRWIGLVPWGCPVVGVVRYGRVVDALAHGTDEGRVGPR